MVSRDHDRNNALGEAVDIRGVTVSRARSGHRVDEAPSGERQPLPSRRLVIVRSVCATGSLDPRQPRPVGRSQLGACGGGSPADLVEIDAARRRPIGNESDLGDVRAVELLVECHEVIHRNVERLQHAFPG